MIIRNYFLKSFLISLFTLGNGFCFAQSETIKNPWVKYEVSEQGKAYEVDYVFMDHFGNKQNFKLSIPVEGSRHSIEKFGVPNWLFDPYVDNPHNRAIRQKELEEGLFRLHGDVIEVDKSRAVSFYCKTYGEPIAQMIQRSLAQMNKDTRRDRIEMAMRFIQDIPYGIPLYNDKLRHYGGVNVPPKLLIQGLGDCDSKALLFVCILVYLIPSNDIIFLNQKDHLLTAIKEKPDRGLTYVTYHRNKYLIAETAGPGKRLLGEKGNYYRNKFQIEPLNIKPREIIEYAVPGNLYATTQTLPANNQPDNTLILENNDSRYFRFQISTNGKTWKKAQLKPQQIGKYVFDTPTQVFVRFKSYGAKYATYELNTGDQFTIHFDAHRKKWELVR